MDSQNAMVTWSPMWYTGAMKLIKAGARYIRIDGKRVRTPEYTAWLHFRERCYDETNPNYKHYGGRGINVCNRWLLSFDDFLEDVGKRPSQKYSLDRINNDGNYQPGNVRWADRRTQMLNRRLHSNNTSGYRGVTWNKRGRAYMVSISVGSFKDIKEAALAYNKVAKLVYGDEAPLNKI